MDTSAQQRSMLIKIKERKRYEVRIVAVNKVGWSEPNTIVLEGTVIANGGCLRMRTHVQACTRFIFIQNIQLLHDRWS